MRKFYKRFVCVTLNKKEAKRLLSYLKEDDSFKEVKDELKKELAPQYEYTIKCQDCPRKYKIVSNEIISEAELKKGGICSICSEDYK